MNDSFSQDKVAEYHESYLSKLLTDCLPFWLDHAVDQEHGGFMTALDRDGTVLDTDKSIWHQGRFSWLLGELYNAPEFSQHPDRSTWLDTALHGIRFLMDKGFDPQDGRMWFQVNRQGEPIRKRRYAFSEAFAAIAFGEVAQATGEQRYQELALKYANQFLDHDKNKNIVPKFESTRPMKSIGGPMIAVGLSQELRRSIGWDGADAVIEAAISEIESDFVHDDQKCVLETVGENGEVIDHFDGRTLNPGHAIETAWFILQEGKLNGESNWIELGCKMLDWMFERGWDKESGGLLYFVDIHQKPVQEYWHDMKFWWPHNEAVIASLLAYQLTGRVEYWNQFQRVHEWAFQHFDDPEHGEWYGYLHRDGSLSVSLKGNLWKGPFHYPRMLLFGSRILSELMDGDK